MRPFSTTWKASVKPRKQRSYLFRAPLHIKGTFLHAHLSKELSAKYGVRSLRVRKGDRVKVMRGSFKKKEGRVESVNIKRAKIFVEKIELTKREGGVVKLPLRASNLLIIELNTDDKRRLPTLAPSAKKTTPVKSA